MCARAPHILSHTPFPNRTSWESCKTLMNLTLAAPSPWLCLLNTVHHAGHEEWSRGATCPDRATRIFLKILRNILLNRVKDIFSLEFPRKHHKISNRYNVNICQHHKKVRGVRAGSSFPCRLFSKDVLVPIC